MKLQTSVMFMGVAGSGKSTQVKLLSEKTNSDYIAAGNELKKDPEMLKFLKSQDEIPYDIIYNWTVKLLKKYNGKNLIFDGFFRNTGSLDAIRDLYPRFQIIYLPIESKKAITRIIEGNRGRADDIDPKNIAYRESADLEKINILLPKLDNIIEITNTGTITEIHDRIVKILTEKGVLIP